MILLLRRLGLVSLLVASLAAATLFAADKSPRELLPLSTVIYAEIPQPQKVLDAVLDHPAVADVQNHPDYKKALEGAQAQQFLAVLKTVEDKLGMKWRPAVTTLTGRRIYVGVDI